MALTRVAPAGIGSTPGTGYVIGDSFLHATGLNATNAYYTGIVTAQTFRVIGDFQVDGTTTTLDTVLTEVDKLEVGANNNTVGVAITQSGSGANTIFTGGYVRVNTGVDSALELNATDDGPVYSSLRRSGTRVGYYGFGGSGSSFDVVNEVANGQVNISTPGDFKVTTNGTEKLRITSAGNVGIGSQTPGVKLDVQMPGSSSRQNLARFRHEGQTDLVIQGQWGNQDIGSANGTLLYNSSQTLALRSGSSGNAHVVLRNTGNIGIGTDNPQVDLHLHDSTNTRIQFTDDSVGVAAGDGVIMGLNGDDDFFINNRESSKNLLLFTENTERLRIASDGTVIVGTDTTVNPILRILGTSAHNSFIQFADGDSTNVGQLQYSHSLNALIVAVNGGEKLRIKSDGTLNLSNGTINLGTADSSSGHINAYELMTFNIDSDNDDSNRHFTWYKNGESGGGTGMMRLTEDARLVIGGDLGTSANNLTLKHATGVEIDMNCTSGSGNNFRLKSDSNGAFTIRDHSASADRLIITDTGRIEIRGDSGASGFNLSNAYGQAGLLGGMYYDGSSWVRNASTGRIGAGFVIYTGGHAAFLSSTENSGNTATVTEKVRFMNDGNVGIGDPAPSEKLNVAGNIMLEGGDQFMYLSNAGTGNAGIYVRGNTSGSFLRSHTTGMFTWEVTGSEKLRLSSDGKLMTSAAGYIYTTSSSGSLSLYGGNTNLGGGIVLSGGNTNGDIRFYAQMSTSSPAQRMVVGATGQVEVSNTVSSNDAAVNIYKASGSNSDKAILRVGYNAAACFEIYRIRNNGTIFMGPNQSGAALSIQNHPTGGSITERLVLQPTGNIYYYGTSGSNQIISQRTNSAGSDGDYFFHLRAQNSSSQDCGAIGIHRDGANDGGRFSVFTRNSGGSNTERIRVDSAGTLRVAGAIASMAGDNSLTDFSAGRVQATRFRRGTSNGTRFNTITGYIGDMLSSDGVQMSHVFYMGQINSSSSSNATQNMFSYYTSGHWGQYTSMRVWMHTDYYNHGYQVWDVYNGSITSVASRGSGGNLSQTSTTVGSGTHSGQNVTRYNVTVENPGTYFQVRWYVGLYFGATMGVYSSQYSESSMDTYLSTRGSGLHLKGLAPSTLSSCPMYRTQ